LNLLIDTHILLWSLNEPERLSAVCREALESPQNQVWVSSISVWELTIKAKIGKIRFPEGLFDAIEAQGMQPLPFTIAHAAEVAILPLHHHDPFDRALLAQASKEKLRFVTADKVIRQYAKHVNLLNVDS
jgi:PIN domain nuclease of toxin-antitoxin system